MDNFKHVDLVLCEPGFTPTKEKVLYETLGKINVLIKCSNSHSSFFLFLSFVARTSDTPVKFSLGVLMYREMPCSAICLKFELFLSVS